MGQVVRVREKLPLMRRILVEYIDALTFELIRTYRQEMLQRPQGLDTRLVEIFDFEILGVGHHHVDGHFIKHLEQLTGLVLLLHLRRHDAPGEHGADIVAAPVMECRDEEVQPFATHINPGLVGQVAGIGQQLALMRRILVENIDRLAKHLIGLDRKHVLEFLQRFGRRLVEVINRKIIEITGHDTDRHVLDHLT